MLRGYRAQIDPQALDLGLLAFIFVRADEQLTSSQVGMLLGELPAVQEVHHVAGEDCYLVKVRVADTAALSALLREGFGAIPAVRSTRTTIVLTTLKETAALPLGLKDDEHEVETVAVGADAISDAISDATAVNNPDSSASSRTEEEADAPAS